MSKQPLKYLKNEVIENVTASRIRQYEAKAGLTVKLPAPIEKIVEQVLRLDFEWDEIEEQPGEQILGGLVAAERKIVPNEKHLALFQAKPGLDGDVDGLDRGRVDRRLRAAPGVDPGEELRRGLLLGQVVDVPLDLPVGVVDRRLQGDERPDMPHPDPTTWDKTPPRGMMAKASRTSNSRQLTEAGFVPRKSSKRGRPQRLHQCQEPNRVLCPGVPESPVRRADRFLGSDFPLTLQSASVVAAPC